jgi:hypothetical protein
VQRIVERIVGMLLLSALSALCCLGSVQWYTEEGGVLWVIPLVLPMGYAIIGMRQAWRGEMFPAFRVFSG